MIYKIKFKIKKEVDEYFNGDKIECLICHRMLKAVGGRHLKCIHGISVEKYKTMFGLPQTRGLVAIKTAKKMRERLNNRRLNGDESIMSMTPEKMEVAQHSPRHNHPPYHFREMKKFAKKGRKIIKEKADERLANIDWNKFLLRVKQEKSRKWILRGKNGWPSDHFLYKKLKSDPIFAKKYKDLMAGLKIKNNLKNKIIEMSKKGISQRNIGKRLSISKSSVARIQRIEMEIQNE